MTDYCLGFAFSNCFTSWTEQDMIDTRKMGTWSPLATEAHDIALQLVRIAMPLNDLTSAFVSFTRVLYMKPIFKHEDGTSHPINTVVSLKRLFQLLQV